MLREKSLQIRARLYFFLILSIPFVMIYFRDNFGLILFFMFLVFMFGNLLSSLSCPHCEKKLAKGNFLEKRSISKFWSSVIVGGDCPICEKSLDRD